MHMAFHYVAAGQALEVADNWMHGTFRANEQLAHRRLRARDLLRRGPSPKQVAKIDESGFSLG